MQDSMDTFPWTPSLVEKNRDNVERLAMYAFAACPDALTCNYHMVFSTGAFKAPAAWGVSPQRSASPAFEVH